MGKGEKEYAFFPIVVKPEVRAEVTAAPSAPRAQAAASRSVAF
jgi:hypothetical protein